LKLNRIPFGSATPDQLKSPGQLFIESDPYKKMIESKSQSTQNFQLKSFFKKDLDSTLTSGGLFAGTTRYPEIVRDPDKTFRMRDLLNVARTTSNSIEFIEETGFTNLASPVAEKALKPQSDIAFDIRDASVKTIAHWIPITRQISQDAPQLMNYVNNRLLYGLEIVEENQILYGSGVGEDLQGIMTNTAIQNAGNRATGETMIDFIRTSITLATLAGYPVTGIILHPNQWQDIEMSKGTDGHYIWVSVVNGGEPRLWRVPVVESTSITSGEFLLGAFGIGAQLWDREESNVRISEHHADYFARNMLAMLAEERLALTTYRPESFVKGSFTVV
jgi:HK97 family phage major capsid protein